MSLSKLDQLYRQVILDAASHPKHHGELADATQSVTLKNPSCGDLLTLDLDVQDGVIQDIAFSGSGCTISQASASLMTTQVLHQPVDKALADVQIFSDLIIDGDHPQKDQLGDAAILVGVHQFPARIKCATLAWKALYQALTKGENNDDRDQEY